MDHMSKSKINLNFQDFFPLILGWVAQRPKVLAGQEFPAVCNVIEVLEVDWCLVWDSHWEGRNISAGR